MHACEQAPVHVAKGTKLAHFLKISYSLEMESQKNKLWKCLTRGEPRQFRTGGGPEYGTKTVQAGANRIADSKFTSVVTLIIGDS